MKVILSDKQVEATAKMVASRFGITIERAEEAVIDLATHDMTEDTHWRQGLGFVFVVYHGNTTKMAEICVDPLAI